MLRILGVYGNWQHVVVDKCARKHYLGVIWNVYYMLIGTQEVSFGTVRDLTSYIPAKSGVRTPKA